MSKVLAVFGATGAQGNSVVNYVLKDPELSKEYKLRAITRDVQSEKAKQLAAQGVEVVQGDATDRASIEKALTSVHTVYIMTVPSWSPTPVKDEYNAATTMADVAVEKGVQYLIFSTLPSSSDISNGKYPHLTPFDAKAKAEKYIRGLPIKSAFVALGWYMQNFQSQPWLAPKPASDGTWVWSRPFPASIKLPLIDVEDTGKFVGAILAEPDKYEGQTLRCATTHYSCEEIVAALSKNTGKTVVFKQVSYEDFKAGMPFVPELWSDGMHVQEEYGYFGTDSEKLVDWGAKQARGKLTTLDEFLEKNPFQLL